LSFIDDLSTWYLRRSRDRFKTDGSDKDAALGTLRFLLHTLARVMAPTMPFFAEELYRKMRGENDPESVHLAEWPEQLNIDQEVLSSMLMARKLSSQALELRERAGIKIRQPLFTLDIGYILPTEISAIIKEEVNVKQIIMHTDMYEPVKLDTTLTPELKEEGMLRDFMRHVQDIRKRDKLSMSDSPVLLVRTTEQGRDFILKFQSKIERDANFRAIEIEFYEKSEVSDAGPGYFSFSMPFEAELYLKL
jgi:isoleucyl-tRNA synthetase